MPNDKLDEPLKGKTTGFDLCFNNSGIASKPLTRTFRSMIMVVFAYGGTMLSFTHTPPPRQPVSMRPSRTNRACQGHSTRKPQAPCHALSSSKPAPGRLAGNETGPPNVSATLRAWSLFTVLWNRATGMHVHAGGRAPPQVGLQPAHSRGYWLLAFNGPRIFVTPLGIGRFRRLHSRVNNLGCAVSAGLPVSGYLLELSGRECADLP